MPLRKNYLCHSSDSSYTLYTPSSAFQKHLYICFCSILGLVASSSLCQEFLIKIACKFVFLHTSSSALYLSSLFLLCLQTDKKQPIFTTFTRNNKKLFLRRHMSTYDLLCFPSVLIFQWNSLTSLYPFREGEEAFFRDLGHERRQDWFLHTIPYWTHLSPFIWQSFAKAFSSSLCSSPSLPLEALMSLMGVASTSTDLQKLFHSVSFRDPPT